MINPEANPVLVQAEEAIRAKLAPDQKAAFEKILKAGLLILDGEQTHQMIASQLKADAEPTDIAGAGVAKLLGVLINQSKGSMPMKAGIPAATVLLLEALDRLEALGEVEVTNETLAAAMQSMSSSLLQLFGVDEAKLKMMTNKVPQPAEAPAEQPAEPQPEAAPPPAGGPQPLIGAPQ